MSDHMRELYYMLDDWAGQQCLKDSQAGPIMERQRALMQKVQARLGENAVALLDAMAEVNQDLEDLHDRALFQAAFLLGVELGRLGADPSCPAAPGA